MLVIKKLKFGLIIFWAAIFCFWGQSLSLGALTEKDYDAKAKSLALYTAGVIHDLQGETEIAVQKFEESAEYLDSYAVHLRLGADYARLGRLDEAIAELNMVLEQDENNIQARYLLALIFSTQKEFDKAAFQYESILKSFSKAEPENIEIYGYLAQLYYSQKEYGKAIKQFEIILSLSSDNVDVMFLLGSLYLETGKQKKAVTILSRAVMLDPEHDGCLNSLGYAYAEAGTKLDEAQTLVERALKVDPNNGAYLDSLGWVYYKKGDYDNALKYLLEADRYMKDPVIYEHIGDVYYKIEKKEDAQKYWNLSLELLPEQSHIQDKIRSIE